MPKHKRTEFQTIDPEYKRNNQSSGDPSNELLGRLKQNIATGDGQWKVSLLQIIGQWPLAEETLGSHHFVYFIAGEALDWRTLAHRILSELDDYVSIKDREDFIFGDDPPLGMDFNEFRTLLGTEKYRAYLNYFYGVTVEQGLILAVEEEIRKRRVGNGFSPDEDPSSHAYVLLYGIRHETLLGEFQKETGVKSPSNHHSRKGSSTLSDNAEFIYWLFKRRLKLAEPARLASDMNKALAQLERMRQAQSRRVQNFKESNSILG